MDIRLFLFLLPTIVVFLACHLLHQLQVHFLLSFQWIWFFLPTLLLSNHGLIPFLSSS